MASLSPQSVPAVHPVRYEFLDLLRGIAVLLMIEGHAMRALLDWKIRATFEYDIHEMFHGLPAPIFIFAAGAAIALTRRAPATAGRPGTPANGKRHWRRELRLLNVLIVGYALQLSDFSFFRTFFASTPEKLKILLNFNVLQCIVVSVLLVRLVSAIRVSEIGLSRLLGAATILFGLSTPMVWSAATHLPIWLSSVISRQYSSFFPLFPYAGFALGGAAWATRYRLARADNREDAFLHRTIVWGGLALLGCVALAAAPWPRMYSDFWWSSPWYLWLRIALLTILCAFLRRFEINSAGNPGRIHLFLALLGRQSFYLYVGHLLLLYGSSYNYNWNMIRQLGINLPFWPSVLATACLALVMISSAILWDWAKRNRPVWANRLKWGFAAYLTTVFMIS
jgi:uncharacterized membrane protein